jgi:predicted nucleic acid-binding Zn ribbon protein
MPLGHEKRCGECGTLIIGRIDKRFCSDQCRNTFNNRLNSDVTSYIRNTNHTLRKNRRILMELNPEGKIKVSRNKLLSKGFDFTHFTGTSATKEGTTCFYCYEQGYLPIEKDYFLLIVRKEL